MLLTVLYYGLTLFILKTFTKRLIKPHIIVCTQSCHTCKGDDGRTNSTWDTLPENRGRGRAIHYSRTAYRHRADYTHLCMRMRTDDRTLKSVYYTVLLFRQPCVSSARRWSLVEFSSCCGLQQRDLCLIRVPACNIEIYVATTV